MKYHGRSRAYTTEEIEKTSCCACTAKAVHQWKCCANGNRYLPICIDCDVDLNEMVLMLMRVPNRTRLMAAYRRKSKATRRASISGK